ncbi:MAG: class I SAM-dependent methyltransferase [Lachnospiraceae bacterium]|nr:class I SAM-dependent methyltransferase [Lachnospiraceae bacterium]
MERQKKAVLSDRLFSLVEMLRGDQEPAQAESTYRCVADVGCDHGFVSIRICQENIAQSAIASDVKEGPLLRAKEHVEEYGMQERISTVLSNGMQHLHAGEADGAIIAGMGGFLMRDILKEAGERQALPPVLILQPQNGWRQLRESLRQMAFSIIKEKMLTEEGKTYVVIRAQQGNVPREEVADPIADAFGPYLLKMKDQQLHAYLLREQRKYDEIYQTIKAAGKEDSTVEEKRIELSEALKRMSM